MSRSTRHWAALSERTFANGLLLLFRVHRWLGPLPFMALLVPVVTWYWLIHADARKASQKFLARVAAHRGQSTAGSGQSLRHMISFGRTLLDKLLAASGRFSPEAVQSEGAGEVLAWLQRGQGVLLVTSHMGCLELCQACAELRGDLALTVLVHTRHAEEFNRIMRRLQPRSRVELLQVTDISPATAMLLSERVARGQLVAMAGDRIPLRATTANTVQVPFLGHRAPFPIGPYVMAKLLACPLFYMSCLRQQRGGHRVSFKLLSKRVELPRARRKTALEAYAGVFVAALERDVLQAPLEWFNFFDFWDQPVSELAAATTQPAAPVSPISRR